MDDLQFWVIPIVVGQALLAIWLLSLWLTNRPRKKSPDEVPQPRSRTPDSTAGSE